ncbi:DeoR/GlpR family transcriptional regulator of sugar metabolism [Arthrobacter sp. PvP023]|uniref:DeoR/GlpR family DNA-binding transcription regulator n=1 Tax=Micrococcaceae TaxID=1268 RepID=UPI001AEB91BD|nr:DeoR/GlpR family DNA-binding transcription regulator [Arthrobacter sp. PvP023]MBP1134093.1 DeoR/GlpR family transcriptional regulator of sugar metabolism [Arthrobacter sp. PvP023]
MRTEERHRLIGELLRNREEVTVDELIAECGASGATIRRDLDTLAVHGVLRRVHGGAKSLVLRGENPGYGQRELEGKDAKARIAAGVADLLQDREHVWLDSGTTATGIARRLRHRELTLMPMSLPALNALTAEGQAGHHPALLVPGGSLIPGELCFRGPLAEANIRSLRFDTAVVTPCAVNLKDGLLAHDLDDAAVKRAGLESAARVIAACAGSKWNAAAVALVAALDAVDIIVTDRSFSPQELTQLGKLSVKVVNV